MAKELTIYDTTLRDGTQAENFNLSVEDKIRITLKLDELGIDFVEGGWPGSNPKDVEFFKEIQRYDLKHARVTSFGSTRMFSNRTEEDPNLQALVAAGTPGVTIFGKTWDIHVTDALRIGLEDNLTIIVESLSFCASMSSISSTMPSIFLTASKPTATTHWPPWIRRWREVPSAWCSAIPTAAPCPPRSRRS